MLLEIQNIPLIMTNSKILLLAMCLGLTKFGFGQTNSETKIIVQISPVYRSGSVGYIPDSYLMVSNSFGEAFQTDLYFTLMSKKKFRQQSDLIDSISKDFKIYLIGFDSTQKQIKEVFTDKNNFGKSFLIPLVPEVMGEKAYSIMVFTKRIRQLDYQIVKDNCDMHWEECEVKILDISF